MDHFHQLLLSLHYCWFLDRLQIHRLHFSDLKPESVKPILTKLQTDGVIEQVRWAKADTVTITDPETGKKIKKKRTRPRHSMWWLTPRGIRMVEGLPNALHDDPGARPSLAYTHDKRTLDTIVTVIERARETGLCGIRLFREEKLNPHARTV
ncbi:MAG TPA: hypothetical protein VGE07_20840, partial [Herpetosiphonaceae bacterium]